MSDQDIQYPIYLDYQSTTPVDPRVIEVIQPYFSELFGNAASKSHQHGHDALAGVEKARKQIAKAINAKPQEIVFTSERPRQSTWRSKAWRFLGGQKAIITLR